MYSGYNYNLEKKKVANSYCSIILIPFYTCCFLCQEDISSLSLLPRKLLVSRARLLTPCFLTLPDRFVIL